MKNDLKDPKSWIPKNLFESYCGTNSENLIKFYDKAAEKKRMNLMSLNWMAILLLPAWLGYRKQWAILITFTIMFSIIPFNNCTVRPNVVNAFKRITPQIALKLTG